MIIIMKLKKIICAALIMGMLPVFAAANKTESPADAISELKPRACQNGRPLNPSRMNCDGVNIRKNMWSTSLIGIHGK